MSRIYVKNINTFLFGSIFLIPLSLDVTSGLPFFNTTDNYLVPDGDGFFVPVFSTLFVLILSIFALRSGIRPVLSNFHYYLFLIAPLGLLLLAQSFVQWAQAVCVFYLSLLLLATRGLDFKFPLLLGVMVWPFVHAISIIYNMDDFFVHRLHNFSFIFGLQIYGALVSGVDVYALLAVLFLSASYTSNVRSEVVLYFSMFLVLVFLLICSGQRASFVFNFLIILLHGFLRFESCRGANAILSSGWIGRNSFLIMHVVFFIVLSCLIWSEIGLYAVYTPVNILGTMARILDVDISSFIQFLGESYLMHPEYSSDYVQDRVMRALEVASDSGRQSDPRLVLYSSAVSDFQLFSGTGLAHGGLHNWYIGIISGFGVIFGAAFFGLLFFIWSNAFQVSTSSIFALLVVLVSSMVNVPLTQPLPLLCFFFVMAHFCCNATGR